MASMMQVVQLVVSQIATRQVSQGDDRAHDLMCGTFPNPVARSIELPVPLNGIMLLCITRINCVKLASFAQSYSLALVFSVWQRVGHVS